MTYNRRYFLTILASTSVAPQFSLASGALDIIATTGMIADTARRIGGSHVNVRALMGSGVDPHAYRQTRTDITSMTRADLVLWHGLYLEAQMEEFLKKLARRQPSIPVADAMPRELLISHADYDGRFDPHVWMVPKLWSSVAQKIARVLSDARPDFEYEFGANLVEFEAELRDLQTYAETALATVPESARVLLTAHDAFSYFGSAFGYEVIGIQGISTESEAGLNRISTLVDMLVERKIGAAFVESSVSDRNIRALIEGAAAQDHIVAIGGELFSDAMGADGTYEATYIGMIDHNITTIVQALGGTVPKRGMNGKLVAGS
ncbi:zinc ABC transporter substrate-binding protein [Planktotalea sp.]|uniref:metal ABC transporter solute-binding protein, Zn/Mn family n=1 Tax=Planktotalea sp. TaxID=2029877 RepID=UPI0025E0A481|nr:zinc ABC transporter substrate-binding protein [Planktotalea sp.]